MGKGFEETFLQRYTNGQETQERRPPLSPLAKSTPKPQGVTTSQPPGRQHKDRPTAATLGENVEKLEPHVLLGG